MKRFSVICTQVFLSIFLLSACTTTTRRYSHPPSRDNRNLQDIVTVGQADNPLEPQRDQVRFRLFESATETPERKILRSANMGITVAEPDSAAAEIGRIATKYKGYFVETGSSRATIRVQSTLLNDAIADIEKLGELDYKNFYGEDVTEQYRDYQIRLDNVEKSRARYLELLSKAENVEATLKVEKELERLNETIELLKGKMNKINHLNDFSTITVYIGKETKPGILGYVFVGLYEGIKWLFVRE